MKAEFSFVHLSDMHVGINGLSWLWPNMKQLIYDDFERLFDENDKCDAIIFSGDLTQKGSKDEFDLFSEIIFEIRENLKRLGQTPKILTIPGNHDLVRPKTGSVAAIALEGYLERESNIDIWSEKSEFRELIEKNFHNYLNWQKEMIKNGIHFDVDTSKRIPGDFSVKLDVEGEKIGIVGLNSAWLQNGDGEYKGKLCIDPRQLLSVVNNE